MSHFSVMVKIPSGGNDITQDELMKTLGEIMAPYQENNMDDCPKQYLEFNDAEDEYREKWESGEETVLEWYSKNHVEISRDDYERLARDEEATIEYNEPFALPEIGKKDSVYYFNKDTRKRSEILYVEIVDSIRHESTEKKSLWYTVRAKIVDSPKKIPIRDYYKTFEEYIEDYAGYHKDEKTGKYGYWENPQAKWDFWQLGGRWPGILRVKTDEAIRGGASWMMGVYEYKEGAADFAKIKDIDFEAMNADVVKKANDYYDRMERYRDICSGKIKEEKEDAFLFLDMRNAFENEVAHKEGEGKDSKFVIDVSREEFLEKYLYMFEFKTWAVIENGQWYEKAQMGWWACHNGTKEQIQEFEKGFSKRFLENEDPETYIAIVDCHI